MVESTIITKNVEQTLQLGQEIAKKLRGGQTILLYGDLGSGKTTLAQGIAKGLGVKGHVTSPTFLIIKRYALEEREEEEMLYHIDAYRLQGEEDAQGLGLAEIFADKKNIVICEWPERLGRLLPSESLSVYCEFVEENTRKYKIKGH